MFQHPNLSGEVIGTIEKDLQQRVRDGFDKYVSSDKEDTNYCLLCVLGELYKKYPESTYRPLFELYIQLKRDKYADKL